MIDKFVSDVDVLEGYSEDGGGTPLRPEYLARPESVEELEEIVQYCLSEKIPLTPTGSRTCDTGSGLADAGLLVSSEKRKKIIEINEDEGFCDVEPGIILSDLKSALKDKGFFYPPDPSSEKIASLGGTVATNAAGARSYKYGHTLNHVIGMEVIMADGQRHRVLNYLGSKCTTGPAAFQQLGRFFVGSEGIFGIFASLRLKIYPGPPSAYAICAFFDDSSRMHAFNRSLYNKDYAKVSPRSVEFLDETCLRLVRDSGKFPMVPNQGKFAVILEQEYLPGEESQLMSNWLELLDKSGALLNDTIVADSEAKIAELRELRHFPPSSTWEMGKQVMELGGKKISTDWAVPVSRLEKMMIEAERICQDNGFPAERVFRYAHLGDGHPHYNFIPKNIDETTKCLKLREKLSLLALKFGGTVAGEHGVGKFRRSLYQLEENSLKNKILRSLKQELDPAGIFAPGNIVKLL